MDLNFSAVPHVNMLRTILNNMSAGRPVLDQTMVLFNASSQINVKKSILTCVNSNLFLNSDMTYAVAGAAFRLREKTEDVSYRENRNWFRQTYFPTQQERTFLDYFNKCYKLAMVR